MNREIPTLRLVRLILGHQDEMNDLAAFIHRRNPTIDLDEIKKVLRFLSFVWTMHNVERVVGVLNKPEIRIRIAFAPMLNRQYVHC